MMKLTKILALATVLTVLSVLAVASTARAEGPHGTILKAETVLAYSTDVYRVTFYGGEVASVGVVGDGDTDLDLFVYDGYGNRIASDTGPTDNCLVRFVPLVTRTYTIKVVNRGGVRNRYLIAVK